MKKTGWIVAGISVVWLTSIALSYAEDTTTLKGFITRRAAEHMTVQTPDKTSHTVVLTDDTKVRMPKGLIGLRHKDVAWTSLIPGLAVTVKGEMNPQGQLVATEVDFTKENLQQASMVQAGLAPTQTQVEANQRNIGANQQNIEANRQQITTAEREVDERFASLADYEVKGEFKVLFKPSSSEISEQDKAALSQLASSATKLPGYLIEVKGFADSTGTAAMNQTLSRDRAEAVIDYLMQQCSVPPRHVMAPGAMGISDPIASNETAEGRSGNRRVEVTVLVNKGAGIAAQ